MSKVTQWSAAFGRFWWGFIIGDDWTVAAAVGLALVATWALARTSVPAWWLLPAVVVLSLAASVWRLERRTRRE